MSIRYPVPLRPGDRIAVTSPSRGVSSQLRPRLDFCLKQLRDLATRWWLVTAWTVRASPALQHQSGLLMELAQQEALRPDPTPCPG
jgi:hypothetical protein